MLRACSDRPVAECTAELSLTLKNETWRHRPLQAYTLRLRALMDHWKTCRRAKPAWRGVFKLATAPRSRSLYEEPETADCHYAQSGHGTHPHHLLTVNQVARRLVENAGFEVFEPWAATLHASPRWFDALPPLSPRARRKARVSDGSRHGKEQRGLQYDSQHAEALSDMVTQMLINQLCAR